jgi:hypothetical protein
MARAPRPPSSWLGFGVLAGLLAVVLLRVAVAAFVGLARLVLVVVAAAILWFLVRRTMAAVRRR